MNIRLHSQHMQEWLCSSRSLTSNTSTKVLSYIKVGYLTLKCVIFKAFQLRSARWLKVLQGDFASGTKKTKQEVEMKPDLQCVFSISEHKYSKNSKFEC